jgi:hypothetical protein
MKDFTGRPLDDMHVVNVNLQRRNLNEFQRPGTLTAVDAEHDDAGNAVAERKTDLGPWQGVSAVSARLFPRVTCSRPGILHFSRVLCVFQYDHEIVTIGMPARGRTNITMANHGQHER